MCSTTTPPRPFLSCNLFSCFSAILYAIGAVGPAAGYLLGGFFLTFYVDLGSFLSSDDPRFIGAWYVVGLVAYLSSYHEKATTML